MIRLENVHLHYSLRHETSLKSHLFSLLRGARSRPQKFHALKGITLSVSMGERIGVVGHNGAGKTTLLRTIAGLYPISKGRCLVQGNIRSLFELSLGFECEATGRENILYRGLLLGQTPKMMKSLSEEIIRFADIGPFIDYPLKTYSAGMLVRLAFAISTFIEGDILLIDEIIAAGDAAFMKKATEKIRTLISRAKIFILVSHDLSAIRSLCNRLWVLQKGELIYDGTVEEGLNLYLNTIAI